MSIRLGQIARQNCDVLIELDNGAVHWMHFQECEQLIRAGQRL